MKKRFAIFLLGLSVLAAGCGGNVSSKTGQSDTGQTQEAQQEEVTEQSDLPMPEDSVSGEEQTSVEASTEEADDSEDATLVTEDGKSASNQDEQSENGEAVTPVEGETEVLQAILLAMPGTAGSSLKAMSGAVTLLDWTIGTAVNTDQELIIANAKAWAIQQAENGITKEELLQALDSVQAEAVLIKTDPEGVAGQLEDAGVELTKDYSAADVDGICGMLREGIQTS